MNRPKTRDHGNVKIMDKASAYLEKKNLEIPATFKVNLLLHLIWINLLLILLR